MMQIAVAYEWGELKKFVLSEKTWPVFSSRFSSLTQYCRLLIPPSLGDNSVKVLTDCADKCVKTPDASVVTVALSSRFAKQCRCLLYADSMLNTNTKTYA
jgi:hypothetical protein